MRLYLTGFECCHYRNYERCVVDFSKVNSQYTFNNDLVKGNLVRKALIIGDQYSGKTNLLLALTDIVDTVCYGNVFPDHVYDEYRRLLGNMTCDYCLEDSASQKPNTQFKYSFCYGKHTVSYTYCKTDYGSTLNDGDIDLDSTTRSKHNLDCLEIDGYNVAKKYPLIFDSTPNNCSILNVIKHDRSGFEFDLPVREVADAIVNWAYGLLSSRVLIVGGELVDDKAVMIDMLQQCQRALKYDNDKLLTLNQFYKTIDFDQFASSIDTCEESDKRDVIEFRTAENSNELYSNQYFKRNNSWHRQKVINGSSQYCQLIKMYWYYVMCAYIDVVIDNSLLDNLSHHTTWQFYTLLRKRSKVNGRMVIVASNNIELLSTQYTRPDCVYIVQEGSVSNMYERSKREIRSGNNLYKLYIGGAFE